jgi:uncharacterized protein YjbI with pentapeptide repeats
MRPLIAGVMLSCLRGSVLGRMALVIAFMAIASAARGDIFEWTISGGSVVQSSTLCPDGSGVSAVPGAFLGSLDLTQAYLVNADLSTASLSYGTLTNANLSNANVTNADLTSCRLTDANLIGADARGTSGLSSGLAITTNMIRSDGTVQGLSLSAADSAIAVRNYSGAAQIPIRVTGGMNVPSGTTLQVIVNGTAWGSTISFDPGIPVALGGSLELGSAPGTSLAGLAGTSCRLFDWMGVSPTGRFTIVNDLAASGYQWDTSALYGSGNVVLENLTNGQWSGTGSVTWNDSVNWTGGNVPGICQDTAVFGPALTDTATITLNAGRSLSSLGFSTTTGASHVINPAALPDGSSLTNARNATSIFGGAAVRAWSPAAVPEPSTLALLGVAAIGLGFELARRQDLFRRSRWPGTRPASGIRAWSVPMPRLLLLEGAGRCPLAGAGESTRK